MHDMLMLIPMLISLYPVTITALLGMIPNVISPFLACDHFIIPWGTVIAGHACMPVKKSQRIAD